MMTEALPEFARQLAFFDQWAESQSDRRDSDWPTDYPRFGQLVDSAVKAMKYMVDAACYPDDALEMVARAWSLTEEPESLQSVAIEMGDAIAPLLPRLFLVGDWAARWQIVAIADRFRHLSSLVMGATKDIHPYVRKRAWLSLASIEPGLAVVASRVAIRDESDEDVRTLLERLQSGL